MSVRMRLLLMAVLLLFLSSQNAFAEAPPTISELLRQHNVELNRQGLICALKSPDADVRYLSAMKLAEDKVADAIPAIKEALGGGDSSSRSSQYGIGCWATWRFVR